MEKLIQLIRFAPGFASLSSATEAQVQEAEKHLQLTFSDEYHAYLMAFGAATFHGREWTGICESQRLHVVPVTLHARKTIRILPPDAYVVEELLVDHAVVIQQGDGTVWLYAEDAAPQKVAPLLSHYVFQFTREGSLPL